MENALKLMNDKLDFFRATAITQIGAILSELSSIMNYDLLNKNPPQKTLWFLEKIEGEGIIKKESDGKYKLLGKPVDLIQHCLDMGYIDERKSTSDVLTPEMIYEFIDTGCNLETIKKYIREEIKDKKNRLTAKKSR
jgi:hypothetical protein